MDCHRSSEETVPILHQNVLDSAHHNHEEAEQQVHFGEDIWLLHCLETNRRELWHHQKNHQTEPPKGPSFIHGTYPHRLSRSTFCPFYSRQGQLLRLRINETGAQRLMMMMTMMRRMGYCFNGSSNSVQRILCCMNEGRKLGEGWESWRGKTTSTQYAEQRARDPTF